MCPSGLVFADGTRVTADLIVFATGFVFRASLMFGCSLTVPISRFSSTTVKDVAQKLLGPEIAESVNDFGAWDQDWEFAGIWRPSGRKSDHLWDSSG